MSTHGLPPHLDPRGRHRGGTRSGIGALRPIGWVVGSIVSIGLLVLAGYTWYQFRDLNDNTSRVDVAVGVQKDDKGVAKRDIDGTDQNILLVGNDDRSTMSDKEVKDLKVGRGTGSLATDTMMIVHVPANGDKATLISLPRDTQVDVPGYGMDKLNAPYALAYTSTEGSVEKKRAAGANLLIKTISEFTGLSIDHYVQIDQLGFYRMAEAIGGVPVTLCHDVDDRHKTNVAKGSDGGSGLYLDKGRHVLTAKQALAFVRQRHNLPAGDFDRVKRQQYFLTAAFRQVASVDILFKMKQLSSALQRSVYLDRSLDLLDLATQMQNLAASNIVGKTIPVDIQTGYSDPKRVQKFVDKVIAGTDASAKKAAASNAAPRTSAPGTTGKASGSAAPSTAKAIDSKCIN